VEGRSKVAVAHLAVARSQNTGTGILGVTLRKRATCNGSPLHFYASRSENVKPEDIFLLCVSIKFTF